MAFNRLAALFGIFAVFSLCAVDLHLGDDAPDFFLRDQEGYMHSLYQHRGQYVLLFFYPRSFIPHSIREVLAFERAYKQLKSKNVVIYGISNDFQNTHQKFHEAYKLTYDLLSDPDEDIIKAYRARSFLGRKFVSYLISPDGRIYKKYDETSPIRHPLLALSDLPN